MHNDLSIAILAGLGGMLGWGSADFFAKKTIDVIGDLRTLFWAQLIGIGPLLVLFLLKPTVPHINHYDPLFLVLFGIISALSYLPLYAGFGKGQISLLSPIFASYSVIVVILAAIFLGATIGGWQLVAILIVFAGILLINTNPRDLRTLLAAKRKPIDGVAEVLLATVVYSFWLTFLDKFLNGKDWVFFLLVIRIAAVLTLAIYAILQKQALSIKRQGLWKYVIIIGLFDVAAFGAVSYGFSHSSYVGIVAMLSATFSLPTMLLAYLFLKERIQRYQIVAAVIILTGVILVSLS